jgi:hypothetical protein
MININHVTYNFYSVCSSRSEVFVAQADVQLHTNFYNNRCESVHVYHRLMCRDLLVMNAICQTLRLSTFSVSANKQTNILSLVGAFARDL